MADIEIEKEKYYSLSENEEDEDLNNKKEDEHNEHDEEDEHEEEDEDEEEYEEEEDEEDENNLIINSNNITLNNCTIISVYEQFLKNNTTELQPSYQRSLTWSFEKMLLFLDSLYYCPIIPAFILYKLSKDELKKKRKDNPNTTILY
jgi:ABC-type Zn2+ transport system substrate-binding protein/surface adhesin